MAGDLAASWSAGMGGKGAHAALYGGDPVQSDLSGGRSALYRVHAVQPDGGGGLLLNLNSAAGENDAIPQYPEGFGCRGPYGR